MGFWTPVERPGSRKARSWAFDVFVALVALGISGLYAYAAPNLPVWAAYAIVAGLVLPLLLRRVWPGPVFAWSLLLAAATGWWASQVVWSPALVISLYTVAVLRPRREALVATALLLAGAVASAVRVFPAGWFAPAAALVAIGVTAAVLGLYIGIRRDLMDELRDRAERLEHERDQQAALAAAAERARIAREMHDIVAHHLSVMVALADGAAAQATRTPGAAIEAMRTVSATGRATLTDTRRLLGVLRDDRDGRADRAPLPGLDELDDLVARVRATGLTVRYDTEGARPELAPAVQVTLFRLVQEALTNTMKHGGEGARAAVRVRFSADEVAVDVEDDGCGGSADGTAGRGLVGMRERMAAFGGMVSAGPRGPHGWAVSARLRLDGTGAP